MSVLPLNLIKGTRSVVYERLENTEDIDDVEHQIEKLKSKVGITSDTRHKHMPHKHIVQIIYKSLNNFMEKT